MPPPRDPSERVFELTGCFGVRLDETRIAELQLFYEGCRDYFELVTGEPPRPGEAEDLLSALPPGKAPEDKFVIGFFDAPGHLVGVLDTIRDYPEAGDWYVGLLLFGPSSRGRRLGERVINRLEEWVRAQGGQALHLIVTESNPGAIRFWTRMGFEVRGMGKQVLRRGVYPFLRMTRELAPTTEPADSWLGAWRLGRRG